MQSYGHVLVEDGFRAALEDWIRRVDFSVTGQITGSAAAGWGLDPTFLLVNLKTYAALGRPRFNLDPAGLVSVVRPAIGPRTLRGGPSPRWLGPSERREPCRPGSPGRGFIEASLRGGRKVYNFGDALLGHSIHLYPPDPAARARFASYLGLNIFKYGAGPHAGLTAGQRRFLDAVELPVRRATRAVLPFNLGSHRDVAEPPGDFQGPVSTLYCAAADFKANRIVQTHCTDGRTRVVLFDVSPQALEYRRLMLADWDGEEYPRFVRHAFRQLPDAAAVLAPRAGRGLRGRPAWLLGPGRSPDDLDRGDLKRLWEDELREWGGAAVFKRHWDVYRRLPHEFVCCDLLTGPEKLFARMTDEASAVVWWGDAFCTVPADWFYTPEERRGHYEDWLRGLVAKCPRAVLYGSDHNRIAVTAVRAAAYVERYLQAGGGDCLLPYQAQRGRGRSAAGA